MKILIETNCEEELSKVEYHMKRFCIENFENFKLFIDDKLVKEQKR
jgi:hypothetical protein